MPTAPVDPSLRLVDLGGIGRAIVRLRLGRRRVAKPVDERTRAYLRHFFHDLPRILTVYAELTLEQHGTGVETSSIRMIVTPLISSPARIARCMGLRLANGAGARRGR